ncbi:MAG: HAMP domain-containing sensor histidine kinase [Caldilineaceae bacterium]
MFHSIRWRLIVSYTLLTLLTVTLLGVTVLSLMQRYIKQQEEAHLRLNAEALARQAQYLMGWNLPDLRLMDLARTAAILGDFQVRILNRQEMVLADSGLPDSLQQFSWYVPALNTVAVEAMPMTSAMIVGQALPADELPPPPPNELSSILNISDTTNSSVTVIRQSPSLWGPLIEFAVISSEQRATATGPQFNVVYPSMGAMGGVAVAGSMVMTQNVFITQTATSVRSSQVVSVPIENPGGMLGYVELSHAPSLGAEALGAVRRLFAWAAAGVSLLTVVVGLFISRSLTAPLQVLRSVTTQMNAGNLATRAGVQGQDEIAGLARDFNQMAAALEESFSSLAAERDALRRFIADASHELRTPITALRSFNELLLGVAEADPAARQEFLQEGQAQIRRLERITDSLLNLSRLEGGLVALHCEVRPVSELLQNVVNNFKRIAQERDVALTVNLPEKALTVYCDSQQMESALGNLVDNALKFTPPGGEVQIGATVDGSGKGHSTVLLWVKDNGVGIDAEEMPLIFDRFHRGKNVTYAGSGLGLAIVKRIIDMHKGTIEVLSEPGQGSQFVIRLPL